jgi:hypothetical protein
MTLELDTSKFYTVQHTVPSIKQGVTTDNRTFQLPCSLSTRTLLLRLEQAILTARFVIYPGIRSI